MLLLLSVAFVAGLVTVLSPCILPILPIVLGTSLTGGRARPLGMITGLIVSFSIFTLTISQLVALLGLSATVLRLSAIVIIALMGLFMLIPSLGERIVPLLSRLSARAPVTNRAGWWGGLLAGATLGLVWAPCAGPILAAVTTLAATQSVSLVAVGVTLAYALGAGVPLLGIAYGGRTLVQRTVRLARHSQHIQQAFGGLMLATAVLMAFNADIALTVWATSALPQDWTARLQSIEQNDSLLQQLDGLGRAPALAQNSAARPVQAEGPVAPELAGISHWINTSPLTLQALRGKVVLIDFWTYSCINCIRTLPYTTAWYNKYKAQGLVVIGVHSPEFAFEKETSNVEDAVRRYQIAYPVAQDNDFATWRAYENRYWPAEYLIDAQGVIRHTHFGEGSYDETERLIQQLLNEAGATVASELTQGPTARFSAMQTPETYIGFARQERFLSPEPIQRGTAQRYSLPEGLPKDTFAVTGTWTFQDDFAESGALGSELRLHFTARDVYLVMTSDRPAQVEVSLLDRQLVNHSDELDVQGRLTVSQSRLYHLVQLDELSDTNVELRFLQPGVKVYAFTFGG